MYCSQKLGEDFAKFCGLLRIYELYLHPRITSISYQPYCERHAFIYTMSVCVVKIYYTSFFSPPPFDVYVMFSTISNSFQIFFPAFSLQADDDFVVHITFSFVSIWPIEHLEMLILLSSFIFMFFTVILDVFFTPFLTDTFRGYVHRLLQRFLQFPTCFGHRHF